MQLLFLQKAYYGLQVSVRMSLCLTMDNEKGKMVHVGVLLNTAESDVAAAFESRCRRFSYNLDIKQEYVFL
jgi:hypothetical protein